MKYEAVLTIVKTAFLMANYQILKQNTEGSIYYKKLFISSNLRISNVGFSTVFCLAGL